VNARNMAVTVGVLVDKAAVIEAAVQRALESEARISVQQGALIAEMLHAFLEAIGAPRTLAVQRVMRSLLSQAAAGGVLVVSPADAQSAFAEVREVLARGIRDEVEGELREQRDARALPAPRAVSVDPVEPERPDAVDVESASEGREAIADAEVVEDEPPPQHFIEAYGGDLRLAKSAWEVHERQREERARREAERGPSLGIWRPSAFVGRHDIFGGDSSMRSPDGGV